MNFLFYYFYIFLTIFSSHFQVPPAELEHILHTNPEIADAAVVPYGSNPLILCVQKQIGCLQWE